MSATSFRCIQSRRNIPNPCTPNTPKTSYSFYAVPSSSERNQPERQKGIAFFKDFDSVRFKAYFLAGQWPDGVFKD